LLNVYSTAHTQKLSQRKGLHTFLSFKVNGAEVPSRRSGWGLGDGAQRSAIFYFVTN